MSHARAATAVARCLFVILMAAACRGSSPTSPVVSLPPPCAPLPPVAGRQVFTRNDVRIGNRGGQCRDYGGFEVVASRSGTLDARVTWRDGPAVLGIEVFLGAFGERIAVAQRQAGAFCADVSVPVQPGRHQVHVCHTEASLIPLSSGAGTAFELTVFYP